MSFIFLFSIFPLFSKEGGGGGKAGNEIKQWREPKMKDSFLLSFRRHRNENGFEMSKTRIQLLSVLSVGWFPRGATIPVAP